MNSLNSLVKFKVLFPRVMKKVKVFDVGFAYHRVHGIGYEAGELSDVVIPKEVIKAYFEEVSEKCGVDSVYGLRTYMESQIK